LHDGGDDHGVGPVIGHQAGVTAQQADDQHRSFASTMATAHPDQWSQADDPALSASTVWTVQEEVERVLAGRGRSFSTLDGRHLPMHPLDGLKDGRWSNDPHVDLAIVLEELRMLRMEVKDLKRSVAYHSSHGADVKDAVTTIKEECQRDQADERTERVASVDVVVRTWQRNPAYWTTEANPGHHSRLFRFPTPIRSSP
jgi:hypothetical protein